MTASGILFLTSTKLSSHADNLVWRVPLISARCSLRKPSARESHHQSEPETMTRRCHSHIAFRYKRLMLCKYKVSPIQARSSSHAGIVKVALYLASRPFRKRDDVRRRVPLRHTIAPANSSTFLRVSLSPFRYLPCRNESQNEFTKWSFEDRPTTREPGLLYVQLRSNSRRGAATAPRLKSWHDHRNTRYQFPYAPCSFYGSLPTPVSFTTSRFGSQ